MPFIKRVRRFQLDNDPTLATSLGDLAYIHYKSLVDSWKANPRWSTAHKLRKDLFSTPPAGEDDAVAMDLAWNVFFIKYVMKYEDERELENGTI